MFVSFIRTYIVYSYVVYNVPFSAYARIHINAIFSTMPYKSPNENVFVRTFERKKKLVSGVCVMVAIKRWFEYMSMCVSVCVCASA